jgi:hypothetical protein
MESGEMVSESLPSRHSHVLRIARLVDADDEAHLQDAEDDELHEGDGQQQVEGHPRDRARGEQVHDTDASIQDSLRGDAEDRHLACPCWSGGVLHLLPEEIDLERGRERERMRREG